MAKEYKLQLADMVTGRTIYHGGKFTVVGNGTAEKVAITDFDDVAITQPGSISSGGIEFRAAESVESVDVYGYTDEGYPFFVGTLKPNQISEIKIDLSRTDHLLQIPFDIDDSDTTANTERNTGFEFTGNEVVLTEGVGARVITADSGIGIDVGTDSGSNDPDGFIDNISLTTAGFVQATVGFAVGSNAAFVDLTGGDQEFTLGALLCGDGTKVALAEGADANTDEGFYLTEPYVTSASDDITFTLASSADTGSGIICLPVRLHTLASA